MQDHSASPIVAARSGEVVAGCNATLAAPYAVRSVIFRAGGEE